MLAFWRDAEGDLCDEPQAGEVPDLALPVSGFGGFPGHGVFMTALGKLLQAEGCADYVLGKGLAGCIVVDPRTRFNGEPGVSPAPHGFPQGGSQKALFQEESNHTMTPEFLEIRSSAYRNEEEAVMAIEAPFQDDGRASRPPCLGAVSPSMARHASGDEMRRIPQRSGGSTPFR